MLRAVPAESVPAVTAEVIAACKSEILLVAPAVKTNVPPVAESWIVVLDPDVNAVVVARGVPTLPCVEVKPFEVPLLPGSAPDLVACW